MPRKQQLVRKVGGHQADAMKEALKSIKEGKSIRKAAADAGIAFSTVRRYYVKMGNSVDPETIRLIPNYEINKVFSIDQEVALKVYYKECALMFYGLTSDDCRRVAFQMAEINNIKMPQSWTIHKKVGKDWLHGFRKRHQDLSLRKPEPCSLARATAFNRENVKKFFDNLETILKRSSTAFSNGTRIYNLDETSTSTVQRPQKVIAPKGHKNVGKVTSGEKGTLCTTCCIISTSGHALPPAIIFPRKNFKEHMIKGAPTGTLGLAAPSGWMNTEIFVKVIEHFIKHTNSTAENPTILIMDNHESHLSIEALNKAKATGVNILTLHPHTSAKLQPLDVGVFGPFKTYYNKAVDSWLLLHPGKPLTIYDIAEIVGTAFTKSKTLTNIINAFKKTGIFPFDRDVFSDIDFLPSSVTDRPAPVEVVCDEDLMLSTSLEPDSVVQNLQPSCSSSQLENINPSRSNEGRSPQPSCSSYQSEFIRTLASQNESPLQLGQSNEFISPQQFRSPIKAKPRKNQRKPRNLGKSMIATDTPEKNEIEIERINAANRKRVSQQEKKVKKLVKHILTDSDDDLNENISLHDTDNDDDWYEEDEENLPPKLTERDLGNPLIPQPQKDEFVIVDFSTNKKRIYYIGKVLEEKNDSHDYFISFLRLRDKTNEKFYSPNEPDLSYIKEAQIKYILPKPVLRGSTKRQQSYYYFPLNLTLLNMR